VACHRYWNLILKKPAAPRLLGKDFKEAHHEPSIKTNQIGGMSREAHHPHSHFRIFASLPGLNGPAFVLPGDSPECREKCRTGQHETLVKDLSDLRPHRLNQSDTIHLYRHPP